MSTRLIYLALIFCSFVVLSSALKVSIYNYVHNWQCSTICVATDEQKHKICDYLDDNYKEVQCPKKWLLLYNDVDDGVGILQEHELLQCTLSDESNVYVTTGDGEHTMIVWHYESDRGYISPSHFDDFDFYK